MIDVHCHILPGADDGVQNIEDSIKIAGELASLGFTRIVLTPHLDSRKTDSELEAIAASYSQFSERIKQAGINLDLILGSEVILDPAILEKPLKEPLFFRLSGRRYQLIEIPPLLHPKALETYSSYAFKHDLTPIIAHIERLDKICKDPAFRDHLKKQGFLFQVDLLSFAKFNMNYFGDNARKLLKENAIDLLATDCHSLKSLTFIREGLIYLKQKAPHWPVYFDLERL